MPTEKKFRDTVPLWLAVGITVLLSLPFGLWLGRFNFSLWVGFVVWAEYFALGAKPSSLKIIVPSYLYGAGTTAIILFLIQFFSFIPQILVPGDSAVMLVLFVGMCLIVYSMKFTKILQQGSLPFFNGITMALAVSFSGSAPKDIASPQFLPLWSGLWAMAMGIFGVLLALFNVWILFPREVSPEQK